MFLKSHPLDQLEAMDTGHNSDMSVKYQIMMMQQVCKTVTIDIHNEKPDGKRQSGTGEGEANSFMA